MEVITKKINWLDASKPSKEHVDFSIIVFNEINDVITLRTDIQLTLDYEKLVFVDDNFNEIDFPISHYALWDFLPSDEQN